MLVLTGRPWAILEPPGDALPAGASELVGVIGAGVVLVLVLGFLSWRELAERDRRRDALVLVDVHELYDDRSGARRTVRVIVCNPADELVIVSARVCRAPLDEGELLTLGAVAGGGAECWILPVRDAARTRGRLIVTVDRASGRGVVTTFPLRAAPVEARPLR